MPVGGIFYKVGKNAAVRIYYRIFGTPELHTHLRLRPVITFFKKFVRTSPLGQIGILEPGCGSGINAFELVKICGRTGKELHYTGFDLNGADIEKAKGLSGRIDKSGQIKFNNVDAVKGLKDSSGANADIILLIDIIEHVPDPGALIAQAHKCLKAGGLFMVSVPTPLYPKVFGRRFHKSIGHLKDGYLIEELDRLFTGALKCRRIETSYNTGMIANLGCRLFYNALGTDNKYLTFLKGLMLYPFIWLDLYNSAAVSCTLFAVYEKV